MRTITCILLMIAITGCTADDPGPSMPLPKGSPDEPAPVAMTARNDKMVVTNYWAEDGVMEVSIGTGPSKLGWSIRQEDGEVCRILVSDVELARKLIEIAKKRFPELRTGDVWEASPRYFRAGVTSGERWCRAASGSCTRRR